MAVSAFSFGLYPGLKSGYDQSENPKRLTINYKTRKLATANSRSCVSIRGRPCKNLPL